MARLTRDEAWVLGALGVVAVACLAAGAKSSPGGSVRMPARATESLIPFTPPLPRPVVGPDQHLHGYTYTPHRYPAGCGNDISVLIHGGLSAMALPAEGDMLWLSAPPSEAEL